MQNIILLVYFSYNLIITHVIMAVLKGGAFVKERGIYPLNCKYLFYLHVKDRCT